MAGLRRRTAPAADKPSHTRGIKQGNSTGNFEAQSGFTADGKKTPESTTGVNAKARTPIDPRMPGLFPG
jgi:hypothetical protein